MVSHPATRFHRAVYPIDLRVTGPLPGNCLALLVCAIGSLVEAGSITMAFRERQDTTYIEAALASLPLVLLESSITSVQCLVLLSIYYCCLLKPCQAHDYALIASFQGAKSAASVGGSPASLP
jgi:hypothetical protein